ncbi:MAG: transporter permease, partial [Rhizobium sp.]|nr:transporter permease [Rhizobium sp.]
MIDNIIHAALIMTTPVLLAAIGGLINRTGGIVNIGLDSMMLTGALVGLILASGNGNWLVALAGAGFAGAVMGLLMSLTVTRLDANEIIVGLGFNIVA